MKILEIFRKNKFFVLHNLFFIYLVILTYFYLKKTSYNKSKYLPLVHLSKELEIRNEIDRSILVLNFIQSMKVKGNLSKILNSRVYKQNIHANMKKRYQKMPYFISTLNKNIFILIEPLFFISPLTSIIIKRKSSNGIF